MADTQTLINPSRARRGTAAVIAQYIQDLSHPVTLVPCAPAA
jgi:hypothetical protein